MTTSWGPALHDGYLEFFATSKVDRTVTLRVRADHLAGDGEHGCSFEIRLNVVRAIEVAAWEPWAPVNVGDQEARNNALLRSRMVSIEVEDFEVSGLRIVDATVFETQAGDLTWPRITWMAFTSDDTPVKLLTLDADASESSDIGDRAIAVVFENAEVFRDGNAITVEEFLALGEGFWQTLREHAEQQRKLASDHE